MPAIVSRSDATTGLPYSEYRELLRFDFWYSCAYCSLSECEASGIGFEIDHYRPQKYPFDGLHAYSNLMWSCKTCNGLKLDVWFPLDMQAQGFRLLRPDEDDPNEHYVINGLRLVEKTKVGEFTIEVLYLNRKLLQTVRDLRSRLGMSEKALVSGLQALEKIHLDRVTPLHRARFVKLKNEMSQQKSSISSELERQKLVRVLNHSPLLDPDPNRAAATKNRREYLKEVNALVAKGALPGTGEASS